MNPAVFAKFDATMHFPDLISIGHDNILNIDELREIVNKFGPRDNRPWHVTVLRKNCVVDMDKKYNNISLYHKNRYIDGHPIIATETDAKIELFLPQLMYPNDVAEYLIKKYGQKFNFNPKKFDQKIPLFFDVFEHSSVGMCLSATSPAPRMKWQDVHCTPLSKKDVVTDKNLNQLWPENTGKLPVQLIELLDKNKEKVHS